MATHDCANYGKADKCRITHGYSEFMAAALAFGNPIKMWDDECEHDNGDKRYDGYEQYIPDNVFVWKILIAQN